MPKISILCLNSLLIFHIKTVVDGFKDFVYLFVIKSILVRGTIGFSRIGITAQIENLFLNVWPILLFCKCLSTNIGLSSFVFVCVCV